jgi:hypothetical protein
MIMVRRCADSVTPTDIPVNDPTIGAPWALVMGYIDGRYAWSTDGWNRFPDSRKVRVAVFSTTNAGDVIDRELGDATAAQAVDWVVMRRAAGHPNPIVYCSYSDWQNCRNAFTSRGVAQPAWWVAGYPSPTDSAGNPIIPAGAIAHQFSDTPGGHWDESLVVDYVFGIDPSGADMDEQSIARAVWGMTIQPNGLADNSGKQVAYPAGDIIGYGDDFARQAKDNSVIVVAKVDAIANTLKALATSVDALTTEVAALKSAQQPGLSGTFSISGSGSVSTPTPGSGS